jgi:hypothetical protein
MISKSIEYSKIFFRIKVQKNLTKKYHNSKEKFNSKEEKYFLIKKMIN